ncbi:hypothetical protein CCYA_CCYA05G1526 [Cyanidiococcus yangmingshanensis]|nr:hypothetical protein CCYA_CCYA05G1526 [Cyanidiococcus yangmingshanensis]
MPGNRKTGVGGSIPKDGLGRALTRPRKTLSGRAFRRLRLGEQRHGNSPLETGPNSASSVLDRPDWEEVLVQADLSGRAFTAERSEPVLVRVSEPELVTSPAPGTGATNESRSLVESAEDSIGGPKPMLAIPERPPWSREMGAEALDRAERLAFHRWRQSLDALESQLALQTNKVPDLHLHRCLTPYEKNLQIWRQLWRVIERSQLIVQVLDARYPLLFYSPDLERYLEEHHPEKKSVLLLNKADLLVPAARKAWQRYFADRKKTVWFFSAIHPPGEADSQKPKKRVSSTASSLDVHPLHPTQTQRETTQGMNGALEQENRSWTAQVERVLDRPWSPTAGRRTHLESDQEVAGDDPHDDNDRSDDRDKVADASVCLCSRVQLLNCLRQTLSAMTTEHPATETDASQRRKTVGFVGYPNVGKSSTLNNLLGRTQVAVGPNPGKTKHLQTHGLDSDLILCDAPGLVFPQWVHSRAELICAGVIPIDHTGDLTEAVQLICSRFSAATLARHYGLQLPRKLAGSAHEEKRWQARAFLDALAAARGFRTAHDLTDQQRAARLVLKDYVRGDLLYVHWPPTS